MPPITHQAGFWHRLMSEGVGFRTNRESDKVQCQAMPCSVSLSSASWWLKLPMCFKVITHWGLMWWEPAIIISEGGPPVPATHNWLWHKHKRIPFAAIHTSLASSLCEAKQDRTRNAGLGSRTKLESSFTAEFTGHQINKCSYSRLLKQKADRLQTDGSPS